jgi:CBS domain-containing protein
MHIEAIMQPVTRCLAPSDDLEAATTMLAQENISAVPVCTDDGKLIGLVLAHDLARARAAAPATSAPRRLAALMSKDVMCCRPGDDVSALAVRAAARGLSHAAVVDPGGQVRAVVDLAPFQGRPPKSSADDALDEALKGTFPASDPVALSPHD